MSGGKWVKPAGRVSAPSALVAVCGPGKPISDPEGRQHVPLSWGGCWVSATRRMASGWTYPARRSFTDPEAFHDWLEGWGRDRQCTYVVAPIASDVLTLSRWWERAERQGVRWARGSGVSPNHPTDPTCPPREGSERPGADGVHVAPPAPPEPGYIVSRMVLHCKPDIVSYRVGGRSFCWVSGLQYFDQPETELAKAVKYEWPTAVPPLDTFGVPTYPPPERAELWRTVFQHLADWWLTVKGGPFGRTLGQMGMNFFRKRLQPKTVLAHSDEYAKQLELSGLFGGRASCWYFGDIGNPGTRDESPVKPPPPSHYGTVPAELDHYDYRSMYPTLLAFNDYPVRLLTVRDNRPLESLESLLADYCVIARVVVRSGSGEYPYRHGKRVAYPAGEFTTTLCGPELHRALKAGEILKATTVATYQRGQPFRPMMDELMQLRWAAEGSGNAAWALFVKSMSNAIAGKLAQRSAHWVERPKERAIVRWGEWIAGGGYRGSSRRFRALAGLVWEWTESELGGRPLGACFAYLTSYGRLVMRQLRESLPPRSVVAQDTDGVWVLRGRSAPAAAPPGCSAIPALALRLTDSAPHGRFWSASHYWLPSGWTLAGFSRAVPLPSGLGFRDVWSSNDAAGSPVCPPVHVWHHVRDATLSAVPIDGVIYDDGWAVPCPVDRLPPVAD